MELRQRALQVLQLADPDQKSAAALALQAQLATYSIAEKFTPSPAEIGTLPGHPERPLLLRHTEMARRSPATPEGRAVLVHAIAHIEFNAINLALDIVWRFVGMPQSFYRDWIKVAQDEAYHFSLLNQHLQTLGYQYGDFAAHDGLWQMAEKTADDLLARLALVPRTLEARGLDVTPAIRNKLQQAGDHAAAAILDIILHDEISHVAFCNQWFQYLCNARGVAPQSCYRQLLRQYQAWPLQRR
jgi:uncharacterized ferritin-like protein (DUF455 family)